MKKNLNKMIYIVTVIYYIFPYLILFLFYENRQELFASLFQNGTQISVELILYHLITITTLIILFFLLFLPSTSIINRNKSKLFGVIIAGWIVVNILSMIRTFTLIKTVFNNQRDIAMETIKYFIIPSGSPFSLLFIFLTILCALSSVESEKLS